MWYTGRFLTNSWESFEVYSTQWIPQKLIIVTYSSLKNFAEEILTKKSKNRETVKVSSFKVSVKTYTLPG